MTAAIVDTRGNDVRLRLKRLKYKISALGIVEGQGGRNVGSGDACQTTKMVDSVVA